MMRAMDDADASLPFDPDLQADEGPAGEPIPVPLTPRLLALVAVGGSLGVLARAAIEDAVDPTGPFPWPTFLINIGGAFVLAVLVEALTHARVRPKARRDLRLFAGTGMLGGFTTYSAFGLETGALLREGKVVLALTYAVGTVALGLAASLLGVALARPGSRS
jgi:CrcB protein